MVLVCSSFPLSSTAKNPCLRPVCHSWASCAHTGPDQHHCTCNQGYSGDGQVCMPIDPCQTQNGRCSARTTRCIYDGPGKVKLVQKSTSESEGSEPEPKGIRWKKMGAERECRRTGMLTRNGISREIKVENSLHADQNQRSDSGTSGN